MSLVSLDEARAHLRAEGLDDDVDLQAKIDAAEAAVLTYLRAADESSIAAGGALPAKQATLLLIGEFYANRAGSQDGDIGEPYGFGYLPRPVVALLYPYRDPALA